MSIYFNVTSDDLSFSIKSIGNNWSQENINRIKGFPHYHWLQVEKGSGKIFVDNQEYLLNCGEGILIDTFVPHSYQSEASWSTNFLTFSCNINSFMSSLFNEKKFIFIQNNTSTIYKHFIEKTVSILNSDQKNIDQDKLNSELFYFLLTINSSLHTNNISTKDSHYLNYILPTTKFIESNFNENILLSDLANNLSISPQYLSFLFKKYKNKTIKNFLIDIRLQQAKKLLINKPKLKIQTISDLTGFSSASYFGFCFKKDTGLSPSEFKNFYLSNE